MAPAILLALALPASAAFPDCIHVSTTSAAFKPDMDAVRDCQDKARQKIIDDAAAAGKPPSAALLDKLDDHHRYEMRKFLSNQELSAAPAPMPDEPAENENAPPSTTPDIKAADAVEILKLRKKLKDRSDADKDGNGVTPDMAGDILATLKKQQGGASKDMQDLLDGASKDGKAPSPETIEKLKAAAASSKGQGMDLQLDDETTKGLEDAQKRLAAPVPEIDKR